MADAYRLAFGCFTRSLGLYSEISMYQGIEITTSAKSDTAFQNPSKSHDCHGPKGNVTTKAIRRISESFATLRCEDGEGVNSPRAVWAEGLCIPASVKLLTAWRMR